MEFRPPFLLLLLLASTSATCNSAPTPRNCSDAYRLCTSFLALRSAPSLTLPLLQSMFDVLPPDLTLDESSRPAYVFVRKNCSCSAANGTYLTNTTLTVRDATRGEVPVYDAVADAYGPLAVFPNSSRTVRNGAVVAVRLACGCSSGLWNYLLSYVVEEGDSVEVLASRFGASMDSIETVNGVTDPGDVVVGDVLYIPLDSVPGETYPLKTKVLPVPAPAPALDAPSSTLLGLRLL